QQAASPRSAASGGTVPPPEEALVPAPAPLAPRAVRDTAHEEPELEPLPQQAKPVFAPVNPSRQDSPFPQGTGAAPQEQAAPVFAPVGASNGVPNGAPADHGPNGAAQDGSQNGASQNGHPTAYDSDHTVIRVPGFVGEQRSVAPAAPPLDGPIDSVPSWAPVRDERGRDA
ncbi:hypothetical protein HLB15_21270, partial [Promicromonospora citrea]|nr:hypothetical protein [Promicromonospora citrea]